MEMPGVRNESLLTQKVLFHSIHGIVSQCSPGLDHEGLKFKDLVF